MFRLHLIPDTWLRRLQFLFHHCLWPIFLWMGDFFAPSLQPFFGIVIVVGGCFLNFWLNFSVDRIAPLLFIPCARRLSGKNNCRNEDSLRTDVFVSSNGAIVYSSQKYKKETPFSLHLGSWKIKAALVLRLPMGYFMQISSINPLKVRWQLVNIVRSTFNLFSCQYQPGSQPLPLFTLSPLSQSAGWPLVSVRQGGTPESRRIFNRICQTSGEPSIKTKSSQSHFSFDDDDDVKEDIVVWSGRWWNHLLPHPSWVGGQWKWRTSSGSPHIHI